ncbi:MAG: DUF4062 domain-containing protein [Desulfobacterales bacterium]
MKTKGSGVQNAGGSNQHDQNDIFPLTIHSFQKNKLLSMANGIEFRLFVSSTFADTTVERNALQKHVFPRLQQLCAGRGARFHAIDLRWDVTAEAALDQQTVNICLDEVRRCLATGRAPNFLILLGNRYGWLPPPPQIPASEFSRLLDRIDKASQRKRLLKWYEYRPHGSPCSHHGRREARQGFRHTNAGDTRGA